MTDEFHGMAEFDKHKEPFDPDLVDAYAPTQCPRCEEYTFFSLLADALCGDKYLRCSECGEKVFLDDD